MVFVTALAEMFAQSRLSHLAMITGVLMVFKDEQRNKNFSSAH